MRNLIILSVCTALMLGALASYGYLTSLDDAGAPPESPTFSAPQPLSEELTGATQTSTQTQRIESQKNSENNNTQQIETSQNIRSSNENNISTINNEINTDTSGNINGDINAALQPALLELAKKAATYTNSRKNLTSALRPSAIMASDDRGTHVVNAIKMAANLRGDIYALLDALKDISKAAEQHINNTPTQHQKAAQAQWQQMKRNNFGFYGRFLEIESQWVTAQINLAQLYQSHIGTLSYDALSNRVSTGDNQADQSVQGLRDLVAQLSAQHSSTGRPSRDNP